MARYALPPCNHVHRCVPNTTPGKSLPLFAPLSCFLWVRDPETAPGLVQDTTTRLLHLAYLGVCTVAVQPPPMTHPSLAQSIKRLCQGSRSFPASLLIPTPRFIAPSICPLTPGRIVGAGLRYYHWLMERSLQRFFRRGLSPSSGLSFPHFFGLHTNIIDLFLGGVDCQCFERDLALCHDRRSHLKDMVPEW
jgi:hypothetical protein